MFFLISRGRVRLQTSKVTKRKRKWRILCWEKKDLNGSNHLIHFYPTKSLVFLSLAAMGIPGSQPLQIRILMLPPPGSDPEISHVESDPRISCVQLFCLCFWMLFAAEQFNLKLIHSYSFLDISESRGVPEDADLSDIYDFWGNFVVIVHVYNSAEVRSNGLTRFCPCGRM